MLKQPWKSNPAKPYPTIFLKTCRYSQTAWISPAIRIYFSRTWFTGGDASQDRSKARVLSWKDVHRIVN